MSEKFNNTGIVFLQDSDFTNGKINSDSMVFVMVQGSFCHYCTEAKPAFISASEAWKNRVIFATIKSDGDASESNLTKQLPTITGVTQNGVPTYLLFNRGQYITTYTGKRDEASISEFLLSQIT